MVKMRTKLKCEEHGTDISTHDDSRDTENSCSKERQRGAGDTHKQVKEQARQTDERTNAFKSRGKYNTLPRVKLLF